MGCQQSTETHVAQDPVTDVINNSKNNTMKYPLWGPGEKIMAPKGHGTYHQPVQGKLRYGCAFATADRICNYNRHFAEPSGYFLSGRRKSPFLQAIEQAKAQNRKLTFYDSNTGLPLFTAPVGRSWGAWLLESKRHGWPSFRDAEVNWDYVRAVNRGETVSIHGTHLGHNLPDAEGNRYCINLYCIAGNPTSNNVGGDGPETDKQ